MSIQSEITRINSGVSEQESLINQIKTALEGKAAGGGSGSVETCTVTLRFTGNAEGYGASAGNIYMYYSKATSSGNEYIEFAVTSDTVELTDVVKGSILILSAADNLTSFFGLSTQNAENKKVLGSSSNTRALFWIPENSTITYS